MGKLRPREVLFILEGWFGPPEIPGSGAASLSPPTGLSSKSIILGVPVPCLRARLVDLVAAYSRDVKCLGSLTQAELSDTVATSHMWLLGLNFNLIKVEILFLPLH